MRLAHTLNIVQSAIHHSCVDQSIMPSEKRTTPASRIRDYPITTLTGCLTAALLTWSNVSAANCDYKAGPPDAAIAIPDDGSVGQGITSAWYGNASSIYAHGVLGDTIEAQTLYVRSDRTDECGYAATLDNTSVFEDVTPRVADVTGDGENNVITIESHKDKGASLAIYAIENQQLKKIASTPFIGQRYRWLAPVGTADFNGDGVRDVAYVETPHIAGTLKIWSFKENTPKLLASKAGFSNHKIGQNYITGGLRDCDNGIELVLPDQYWEQTLIARVTGNTITTRVYADRVDNALTTLSMQCK